MSKERRRKQFGRLLTKLYSDEGCPAEVNKDGIVTDDQVERLVKRMAAGHSSIDVTVLDDPDNMGGLLALQRALRKHGVDITEVPSELEDALSDR